MSSETPADRKVREIATIVGIREGLRESSTSEELRVEIKELERMILEAKQASMIQAICAIHEVNDVLLSLG